MDRFSRPPPEGRGWQGGRLNRHKKSKIDIVKEMIQRISKRKLKIDFVLMDSWYGVPILISYIYKFYHVICNVKMNGFKYKFYVRFWHYSFPIRLVYKKFRHFVGRVLRKMGLKK